ncbi:MAG TPA: adenylate/guanylate cyclase domain-containing protein [Vicinamibacterales bacterium]|nr:adenylate/guanylate cyclase domain-containing protein [Vicinamibacterales bacterium]
MTILAESRSRAPPAALPRLDRRGQVRQYAARDRREPRLAAPSSIVPQTAADYQRLGADLLESGEPIGACDRLSEGLARFPDDRRLRQLLALGLARTGASQSANEILRGLAGQPDADEETLGLLARTHKDLASEAVAPEEREDHLRQAYGYYSDAFRRWGGYWTGINAATVALLLGERDEAAALARDVHARCLAQPDGLPATERYWIAATLGEAALILGRSGEAGERYAEAATLGRGRFGVLASTRRNARLLAPAAGVGPDWIDRFLRVPRVAVFAGHLIDAPNRPVRRFPPALEPAARRVIDERLAALDVGFGFAGAACGGDILFLEAVAARGGESHVVLPYDRAQFGRDSVDVVPGWSQRYARVLEQATEVVQASTQRMAGGDMSYEYALRLMDGLASLRADEVDTELVPIALWDGAAGDGPGGTASAVARWRAAGRRVEVIDLHALDGGTSPVEVRTLDAAPAAATASPPASSASFAPRIVGVLFADARGFSGLTDEQVVAFVQHFLGTVAAEVERAAHPPILKNTWGDGLYFVFDRVCEAGEFALRLTETLNHIDWSTHQLPKDLGLRIGLHAGPAYACTDPVTGQMNYLGAHVSRAARIEPVTPPGRAYASQAFAALARTDQGPAFRCEYVGRTPLAKGYGTYPLYVVRRL